MLNFENHWHICFFTAILITYIKGGTPAQIWRGLHLLIFFTEVIKFYWLMLLLYPGELYRLLGASSFFFNDFFLLKSVLCLMLPVLTTITLIQLELFSFSWWLYIVCCVKDVHLVRIKIWLIFFCKFQVVWWTFYQSFESYKILFTRIVWDRIRFEQQTSFTVFHLCLFCLFGGI